MNSIIKRGTIDCVQQAVQILIDREADFKILKSSYQTSEYCGLAYDRNGEEIHGIRHSVTISAHNQSDVYKAALCINMNDTTSSAFTLDFDRNKPEGVDFNSLPWDSYNCYINFDNFDDALQALLNYLDGDNTLALSKFKPFPEKIEQNGGEL